MTESRNSRVAFLRAPLDPVTIGQAVEVALAAVDGGGRVRHASINAAKVVRLQRDTSLRQALWECELATADGQVVVWAARLLGLRIPERVAGIDLMEALLEKSAGRRDGVYLLGARQEVLVDAEREIVRRHPGIRIVGRQHGYFSRADETRVAEAVAAADADLLFVALETPAKELFLARHRDILRVPFAMGVGGAFDVLAGRRARAPRWARRAGLEWLFRLLQEPRRLAMRYAVGNGAFLALVGLELVKRPTRRRRKTAGGEQAAAGGATSTRPTVGLVAPLPPQIGGVAAVADWLRSWQEAIGCEYVTFNLFRPAGDETGGRVRPGSFVRQARLTLSLLRWSRDAPRLVHYCVGTADSGLVRDTFFLALLRLAGITTIAHIHGSVLPGTARVPARRLVLRGLARVSGEIVTIAPNQSTELEQELGIPSRHIVNPIRLDADARTDRGPSPTTHLLFVGTFGELKGSHELLEAVAEIRRRGVDATLRIVGKEHRRGEESALRRETERLGLDHDVEFAGVADAEMLAKHYRSADVFVLPSKREGLPMALLEAMAFGLPVVTTPVGGIPDIVDDGVTGILVEPSNVAAIAAAIELLARDPERRSSMGRAARAHVHELAAPAEIARQWRELYASHLEAEASL